MQRLLPRHIYVGVGGVSMHVCIRVCVCGLVSDACVHSYVCVCVGERVMDGDKQGWGMMRVNMKLGARGRRGDRT